VLRPKNRVSGRKARGNPRNRAESISWLRYCQAVGRRRRCLPAVGTVMLRLIRFRIRTRPTVASRSDGCTPLHALHFRDSRFLLRGATAANCSWVAAECSSCHSIEAFRNSGGEGFCSFRQRKRRDAPASFWAYPCPLGNYPETEFWEVWGRREFDLESYPLGQPRKPASVTSH
jgi:hypothetical protein